MLTLKSPFHVLSALALLCAALFANMANASGATLSLNVNQGQLIRLSQDAKAIFIADPEIASYQAPSSRSLFLFGKKPGETSFYVLGANERVLYRRTIRVAHDRNAMQSVFAKQFPNNDLKISSVANRTMIEGHVKNVQEADRVMQVMAGFLSKPTPENIKNELINNLTIDAPNQVNIRVRIAEMERSIAREFGFNDVVAGKSLGLNFGANMNNLLKAPGRVLEFSADTLSGALKALEEEGLVNILAEPNLTALSGQEAQFLAGGRFPVTTSSDGHESTKYEPYGVGLSMVPTVLSPNRISLTVNPKVSEILPATDLQPDATGKFLLSERSAKTTVELASGQSFILAGLLYEKEEVKQSQLPVLGDIPVLGALFRSERYLRKETELVIIATAYIVEPVSEKNLRTPQDGTELLPAWARFLSGEILKTKKNNADSVLHNSKPHIIGDYGLVF